MRKRFKGLSCRTTRSVSVAIFYLQIAKSTEALLKNIPVRSQLSTPFPAPSFSYKQRIRTYIQSARASGAVWIEELKEKTRKIERDSTYTLENSPRPRVYVYICRIKREGDWEGTVTRRSRMELRDYGFSFLSLSRRPSHCYSCLYYIRSPVPARVSVPLAQHGRAWMKQFFLSLSQISGARQRERGKNNTRIPTSICSRRVAIYLTVAMRAREQSISRGKAVQTN